MAVRAVARPPLSRRRRPGGPPLRAGGPDLDRRRRDRGDRPGPRARRGRPRSRGRYADRARTDRLRAPAGRAEPVRRAGLGPARATAVRARRPGHHPRRSGRRPARPGTRGAGGDERAALQPRVHPAARLPAEYVERVRVDAARRLLESESVLVGVAAARCGFGSAETMRRAFLRRLGVPPDHYRRRFAPL
ncbi:MAG TPA: helix-turn-helix domain-containing protein [Pseudonocardia sp.]|nr:helix-turn-helix domain-containing protein [Pseudonocardia sp.]